jgi:hypothetical protein
MTKTERI